MSEVVLTTHEGKRALALTGMNPEVLGVWGRESARPGHPLLRAVKAARRVVDVTAGLGRDTALLLAAGREVVAIEEQPLLVELWREVDMAALTFVEGDAIERLLELELGDEDVIYMDPMFDDGTTKGQVKRASQMLRALCAPDRSRARALLEVARAKCRTICKRPRAQSPLDVASYSIDGGAVIFDVFLRRQKSASASNASDTEGALD